MKFPDNIFRLIFYLYKQLNNFTLCTKKLILPITELKSDKLKYFSGNIFQKKIEYGETVKIAFE